MLYILLDSLDEKILGCPLQFTDESADAAGHVDDAGAGVVGEAAFGQPTVVGPAPMSRKRVNEAGDHGGEDDVAVEVATLGDGAGHDGGAGGGKSAL